MSYLNRICEQVIFQLNVYHRNKMFEFFKQYNKISIVIVNFSIKVIQMLIRDESNIFKPLLLPITSRSIFISRVQSSLVIVYVQSVVHLRDPPKPVQCNTCDNTYMKVLKWELSTTKKALQQVSPNLFKCTFKYSFIKPTLI